MSDDSCIAYKAMVDKADAARVKEIAGQGALELRLRKGPNFGIAIIAVTVHGSPAAAQTYVDADVAAEASQASADCHEAIASPSLGLSEELTKPSSSAPKGGRAAARRAETADGRVSMIERYGWTRGNVSVVLVMTADRALLNDFDLAQAMSVTNEAIDNAAD